MGARAVRHPQRLPKALTCHKPGRRRLNSSAWLGPEGAGAGDLSLALYAPVADNQRANAGIPLIQDSDADHNRVPAESNDKKTDAASESHLL
jgi:hypothetical protein